MDIVSLFLSQLADPFRIGLIVMLMLTAARTQATAGAYVPLALGVVFVAVLIPTTLTADQGDKPLQIAVGLVSNAILLGAALGVRHLIGRFGPPRR